jgi:integrase
MAAKEPKWSPSMVAIATGALKHLAPFARRLTVDIEARDIAAYQKARLAEKASNRTVNIEVGVLRSVLKRLGLWARIQPHVEMLPEREDAGHALTAAEESILLAECANSRSRILRPFVVVAIETAARYGTIRRLQWRNVDFANRCLTFGRDKTRAGTGRTIPLTSRALETLRFWADVFSDRQPDHFVFPHERYGGSGTDEESGFTAPAVYQTDVTRPIGSVKIGWEQARERTRYRSPQCSDGRLEKASMKYRCSVCQWGTDDLPPGLCRIRFHDLRHTGVSQMITARVPLPIIAKIVGWSTSTTAKMASRYGHFYLEDMRAALESISRPEQVFAGVLQKVPIVSAEREGKIN